jgi:diacylglycerol kinase (ATP)
MRKVVLLYNPLSGRRRERRVADVEIAAAILRSAGAEVSTAATRAAPDSADQARQAIAHGCDTIFACGGDGTIHDVLQGLVGTGAALGVIPLGTANALAHDLRIPFSPAKAARAALSAQPRRIAAGQVELLDFNGQPTSRYFTVAAGAGLDAHLFYQLNASVKGRLGMAAYYAKAWQLWITHRMRYFAAAYQAPGSPQPCRAVLTQLLAVRIRNFGGVLRELAPGASLDSNDLRLVLCHTASRFLYVLYVLRGLLGQSWKVRGIELANCRQVECESLPDESSGSPPRVYVEADGELVGTLPAKFSIIPDAITILAPPAKS